MNNIIPTEHEEAMILVEYLRTKKIPFAKIPNETFTKSWKQKTKNKQEGVSAGIPDYVIFIKKVGVIWIELKRKKGGSVSEHQKKWIETINETEGTEAFVCNGAEQAIKIIENF